MRIRKFSFFEASVEKLPPHWRFASIHEHIHRTFMREHCTTDTAKTFRNSNDSVEMSNVVGEKCIIILQMVMVHTHTHSFAFRKLGSRLLFAAQVIRHMNSLIIYSLFIFMKFCRTRDEKGVHLVGNIHISPLSLILLIIANKMLRSLQKVITSSWW